LFGAGGQFTRNAREEYRRSVHLPANCRQRDVGVQAQDAAHPERVYGGKAEPLSRHV
jgi:hypothetical protein